MPDPTALYPTPTRLALLRDVQAGQIRRVTPRERDPYVMHFTSYRVTAQVAEVEQAGWVELDPDDLEEAGPFQIQHYRLTAAGRKVLADA
jgi:hypothetical protein